LIIDDRGCSTTLVIIAPCGAMHTLGSILQVSGAGTAGASVEVVLPPGGVTFLEFKLV
jgi:hypothetical protein